MGSDHRITDDTTGKAHAGAPVKPETIERKAPRRAIVSECQFLPRDQRQAIYRLFQEVESVEVLARRARIARLAVQDVIRAGNEQQVRQARVVAFIRRAA